MRFSFFFLCLRILNYFFCHVRRRFLIAGEFQREMAPAMRYRAQRRCKIAHLRHWHLSHNLLHFILCRAHAQHAATALRDITHDIAHFLIRHIGL